MSDIAEYERRIAFALERIGRGVEALKQREALQAQAAQDATHQPEPETAPPAEAELPAVPEAPPEAIADPAEVAELKAALAAEQEANAQLSERVRAIREAWDAQATVPLREARQLPGQIRNACPLHARL